MNKPETQLAEHGFYASVVHGHSMEPLLRDHQDTVYIEPCDTLHKRDVVLFRRADGQLVLHRLLKQTDDTFVMCGDNDLKTEPIRREQILGVMTAFARGEKTTPVTAWTYRLYSRVWTLSFPTKRVLRRLYYLGRRGR